MEEPDDTDADDETEESTVEASDPPTDPSFIEPPGAAEAGDRLVPPPLAVSGEAVEGMEANALEGAGIGDVVTVNGG